MAWAGYQLNWIRQRHEFLARHAALSEEYDVRPPVPKVPSSHPFHSVFGTYNRKAKKSRSNFLWLFGEPRQDSMTLVVEVDQEPPGFLSNETLQRMLPEEEFELAERLFPEADLRFQIVWPAPPIAG